MQQVQLISITLEELQNTIINSVKNQLQELKQFYQPKEPTEYLTRQEVSKLLKIDLSSVHNWSKKGILTKYQCGGKIFYKRSEIENAIIKLKY